MNQYYSLKYEACHGQYLQQFSSRLPIATQRPHRQVKISSCDVTCMATPALFAVHPCEYALYVPAFHEDHIVKAGMIEPKPPLVALSCPSDNIIITGSR
jgi:hypothetical protein